jgi:ankyrin repeat protein
VESANEDGWTALMSAAFKGHLEVVKELLKHGAKVKGADKDGWTPLKIAAKYGHMDVVEELQKHGASVW